MKKPAVLGRAGERYAYCDVLDVNDRDVAGCRGAGKDNE